MATTEIKFTIEFEHEHPKYHSRGPDTPGYTIASLCVSTTASGILHARTVASTKLFWNTSKASEAHAEYQGHQWALEQITQVFEKLGDNK